MKPRPVISIEKQSWFGIGMAHIFYPSEARARVSIPVDTKEDIKRLRKTFDASRVEYQS